MATIRAAALGVFVLVWGCVLIYFGEPWLETHVSLESWRAAGASPQEFAMYGSLFTFGFASYFTARVAMQREFCWGAVWSLVAIGLIVCVTWFGSSVVKYRFPLPTREMGWFGLLLLLFYCVAPIVGASTAQDVNRKNNADKAEVAADIALEVVDIVHEVLKH